MNQMKFQIQMKKKTNFINEFISVLVVLIKLY